MICPYGMLHTKVNGLGRNPARFPRPPKIDQRVSMGLTLAENLCSSLVYVFCRGHNDRLYAYDALF